MHVRGLGLHGQRLCMEESRVGDHQQVQQKQNLRSEHSHYQQKTTILRAKNQLHGKEGEIQR